MARHERGAAVASLEPLFWMNAVVLGALWSLSLVVVVQGRAEWWQWLIATIGALIVAGTFGMAIMLMRRRLRRNRDRSR